MQTNRFQKFDIIIIGAGIAGLYTALNINPELKVLLLSKRDFTVSNTSLAQGGIAAVLAKDDSTELHM